MLGMSLREVSRKLGYSVSSLHEHQNKGRFKPLSDGSYDLGEVVDGLLRWSLPSAKHLAALEANKVRNRTETVRSTLKPLTPEQKAAEDRGVAAVMTLVRSEEVTKAMFMIGGLPKRMLDTMQEHDSIEYPKNTLAGFEKQVVEWLMRCIEAARDE